MRMNLGLGGKAEVNADAGGMWSVKDMQQRDDA